MSTYLTSYPQDQWPWGYTQPPYEPPEPAPAPVPNPIVEGNIVQLDSYNDGTEDRDLFLSAEDMSIDYPSGARSIGYWSNDGVAQVPVHSDYDIIRPFGNDEGEASDRLDLHHFQGHAQRDVQTAPVADTLAEYPPDNQPIVLTMDRWMDDTPGWEGNGWKATIEFSDPTRPPNARAIGIYDENWNYLYTTGAFIETQIGTDPEGEPIMRWQTHNPPGRATPEKEPVYYALLLGSAQEGRFELPVDRESVVRLFWEGDQEA